MKRKVKRYAEGEMVDGDEIPMDDSPRRALKDYMANPPEDQDGGYTSPRRASFGEAFSEARRAGNRTFMYGGKRYTTEMASEKKRVRATAPTPDESAAETSRLARQAKMTDSSRDSEGSSGYAVPAAIGTGAAAALAKMAMGRREKKESLADRVKAREAGKSQSGSTVGKMPGSSLSDPYSMQLGSDLDVKRTLRGNKRMGMDSRDTEFKKGGKIKKMAKGGSASSRADGIAQRGKTRGRMC